MELVNLPSKRILPLLSSASVLRKKSLFHSLLSVARRRKINKVKIYEALLQTYLFAGFPSALIALEEFGKVFNMKFPDKDKGNFKLRGEINCRKIYGEKYDNLINKVNGFSPEMAEWLVSEGYGKVLGRKGLSLKERELSIISILSVLKFKNQLYSHIIGAIKIGIKPGEISAVISDLSLIHPKNYYQFGMKIFEEINSKN